MAGTTSKKRQSAPASLPAINGAAASTWHRSAPPAVRAAVAEGAETAAWTAWQKHLAGRKRPEDTAKSISGRSDPLAWAAPNGIESPPMPDWLRGAGRPNGSDSALESGMLQWLGEAAGKPPRAQYALEALACARRLPRLAAVLSSEAWWALLDHLYGTAADAAAIELEEEPLVHQLLAGELALTLAYCLPEIAACRKLKLAGRRAVSSGLVDLLDGEGLPQADNLASLRPLAACWTRCCALGKQLKGGWCSRSARRQYEWLPRSILRLTRHDGAQVFSGGRSDKLDKDFLRAMLKSGGDDDDRQIAAHVLPGGRSSRKKSALLPAAANHSEWAAVTVLRPDWSRNGPRLSLAYPQRSLQAEFGCGKDLLFLGEWGFEVRFDGKPVEPTSDWEEVCWVSDDDVDYLELEIELGQDVRLQRQILLAREDSFLLLADAVLGSRPGKLEYRGCLPLGPGVSFRAAEETREGHLIGAKRRGLVVPLALPEWQTEPGAGHLRADSDQLTLEQTSEGGRLHAPLFFDLDRRRLLYMSTWRRLTVAQSLEIQPPDVAAGYRVAAGDQQWLIYRSLAERANRTLLGHNLSSEMLVARFDETGEVEPLVEIE